MLPEEISNKVLTIGCDYKRPKGGVAQVLHCYASYVFKPFLFVATTKGGGKLKKTFWLFTAIPTFIFRCLSPQIRIVHVHGSSYNSFYRKRLFINIAKWFKKKVVYHIHGGGFSNFYHEHKKEVSNIVKKADIVIALSNSWEIFFKNEIGCKRVVVIPNIIPFHKAVCRNQQTPKQCIFLGTINENKGVYDMLSVFNEHQNEFRGKLILHIGGIGEQEKMLNLISDYGLTDMVIYDGFVSGGHKKKLLESADFFILPSYIEGLPVSILEAMSYSLPILSTSVGGIPEIVENGVNGILIPPSDKDALYHAILKLVSDAELRKQMGEASYCKVQPHFPENVSQSLEKLYTELL